MPILIDKRDLKLDLQVSFWRGFILSALIWIGATAAIDFWWVYPAREREIRQEYEAKARKMDEEYRKLADRNDVLRSEVGRLTGVIVATYGRDAGRVIESYRHKPSKKGG